MGERKVVNKYIPPDFDPKLVPKGSRPKDECVPVRMMLPFTIHCDCGSFQNKGTKYNAKKEPMKGVDGKYLGIQRFRFILKCTACLRPLTFLTDPKNADYEMENGGTRTYEVQKDKQRTEEQETVQESIEEKMDPMKALEKRVLASQREMADLDNLEEIRAMNLRNVKLLSSSGGGVLHAADVVLQMRDKLYEPQKQHTQQKEEQEEYDFEEEERLIQSIQFGSHKQERKSSNNGIQRLDEYHEQLVDEQRRLENERLAKQQEEILSKGLQYGKIIQPPIKIKKKKRTLAETETVPFDVAERKQQHEDHGPVKTSSTVLGLIGEYDSD